MVLTFASIAVIAQVTFAEESTAALNALAIAAAWITSAWIGCKTSHSLECEYQLDPFDTHNLHIVVR